MDCKPSSVRIFGRKYSISYIPEEHNRSELGLLDYEKMEIHVREGQPSIEESDTIIHETIHAIDGVMNLGLSEAQVMGIATGLNGVFQDNSEFTKFITALR